MTALYEALIVVVGLLVAWGCAVLAYRLYAGSK